MGSCQRTCSAAQSAGSVDDRLTTSSTPGTKMFRTLHAIPTVIATGALLLSACSKLPGENPSATTTTHRPPSEWTYVTSSAKGNDYFVDFATRRRITDRKLSILIKINYGHENSVSPRSARVREEFDCANSESRILYSAFFTESDLRGETTSSGQALGPWRQARTGNARQALLGAVCE